MKEPDLSRSECVYREFFYMPDCGLDGLEGLVYKPHRIVRITRSRIYVNRFDGRDTPVYGTYALDRLALERDGRCTFGRSYKRLVFVARVPDGYAEDRARAEANWQAALAALQAGSIAPGNAAVLNALGLTWPTTTAAVKSAFRRLALEGAPGSWGNGGGVRVAAPRVPRCAGARRGGVMTRRRPRSWQTRRIDALVSARTRFNEVAAMIIAGELDAASAAELRAMLAWAGADLLALVRRIDAATAPGAPAEASS